MSHLTGTTTGEFATIAFMRELWLIRHGETEWSLSGAHTGRTDIPLTANGRANAADIGRYLAGRRFALVLVSPLQRALETCRLAGHESPALGQAISQAMIDPNLREWDYGDYEGLTTPQIHLENPRWSLWTDGVPHGETAAHVAARAAAVIDRALSTEGPADGNVALFAHGHILRILAAHWLGLPPENGRLFALGTGSISTLGYERRTRVITRWNLLPSA